jgi:hypothetical protein
MDAQRGKNEKCSRTDNQNRGGCQSDNSAMRAAGAFRFATRRNRRCFHTVKENRIYGVAVARRNPTPAARNLKIRISKFETASKELKRTHLYSR